MKKRTLWSSIEFANKLDYESYIDDLEVRQALNVIRERIDTEKAMAAAAEAAEEADHAVEEAGGDWRQAFLSTWNGADDALERASVSSSRRGHERPTGETKGQPDWDSSTAAGDTKKSFVSEGNPRSPSHRHLSLPHQCGPLRVPSSSPHRCQTSNPVRTPFSDARQLADEMLKSNPSLAAKHSVRSLAAIVDKTSMHDDLSHTTKLPPLRIVR